jgi:hypothetical protein
MTVVVVEKRKTLIRNGLKRGFKLSMTCNGYRGTAKALGAACQHERCVRRDEMECIPNNVDTAFIIDDSRERNLDDPGTSSSSDDDDSANCDPCRTKYTSRLKRPLFPCKSYRVSMRNILAELTLSQNILLLSDTVRRCAKCPGAWCGKQDGRAVVGHNAQWRDVVLHSMFGAARVRVLDWTCSDDACGADNFYDGLNDGVFAATATSVFLRGILDSLVFATCSGTTQRTAYAVFKAQQRSAELQFAVDLLVTRSGVGPSGCLNCARTLHAPLGLSGGVFCKPTLYMRRLPICRQQR